MLCGVHECQRILRSIAILSTVEVTPVLDLLYIAGSLLFFALMLAYVRLCAVLGRTTSGDASEARHER